MSCVLSLLICGGTYNLKSTPSDRIFEKLFIAATSFTFRVFVRNLLRGNHRRNTFLFCFDVWPGAQTLTLRLSQHTDYYTSVIVLSKLDISLVSFHRSHVMFKGLRIFTIFGGRHFPPQRRLYDMTGNSSYMESLTILFTTIISCQSFWILCFYKMSKWIIILIVFEELVLMIISVLQLLSL